MEENRSQKVPNANTVYRYIYRHPKQSKQTITEDLNLSSPTVGAALKYLQERELILNDSLLESTGGRKARTYRCDYEARTALGMDVTVNHISLVLIDMKAHILHSDRIRLSFEDNPEYYRSVGNLLQQFLDTSEADRDKLLGLGICLAANIARDNRTITSARQMGLPVDFYEKLKEYISLPFLMFNDAFSGGFAEFWDLEQNQTILYLSLSNNVGGSMVSRRQIYLGDNNRACKFGHMTLVPEGRPCYCGEKGCVQAYLRADLLSDLAEGKMDLFFTRLEQGQEPYRSAFRTYRHYLAIVVNNLRMQYDCDIVLGGYVGSQMQPYLESFREEVQERNRFHEDGSFLRVCKHHYENAAIGAALYYIDHFIRSI